MVGAWSIVEGGIVGTAVAMAVHEVNVSSKGSTPFS
jgi:hypothetical protein